MPLLAVLSASVSPGIWQEIGEMLARRMLPSMIQPCQRAFVSYLPMSFPQACLSSQTGFGSSLRQTGLTPPYSFLQSIRVFLLAVSVFWPGLPYFFILKFSFMHAPLSLHSLPIRLGRLVSTPDIWRTCHRSEAFRSILDHFLTCHSATDFGILALSRRGEQGTWVLSERGTVSSRFFLPPGIPAEATAIVITTCLESRVTTIRWAFESP